MTTTHRPFQLWPCNRSSHYSLERCIVKHRLQDITQGRSRLYHLATEGQKTDACSTRTSLKSLRLSGSLCFCWNSIAWLDRIPRAPCERHMSFVSCHAPAIFHELHPCEFDGCLTCQASGIWNKLPCFHSTSAPSCRAVDIYNALSSSKTALYNTSR